MSMKPRSTHRRDRHSRKTSKRDEKFHSPDDSDRSLCVSDDESSQILPDQVFHQIELFPVKLSGSSFTLSEDDSSDRKSSSSSIDDSDPDSTGVGVDDQRHPNLASSSSRESVLESSALAACLSSAALLNILCDKLIGSIEDTWSHINEPRIDLITIQEHTNHRDTRDLTNHTGMQVSTHPINALNIQQLDLVNIMKVELIQLEAVAGEYTARKERD
jgi:hypothetical protein